MRWARERRECRCKVGRKVPGIHDSNDPRYFENLFIDDSDCELHSTVSAIRGIAASAEPLRKDGLACGCRPEEGTICDGAKQIMEQMHGALTYPPSGEKWARYQRLKSWLARHYEENKKACVL